MTEQTSRITAETIVQAFREVIMDEAMKATARLMEASSAAQQEQPPKEHKKLSLEIYPGDVEAMVEDLKEAIDNIIGLATGSDDFKDDCALEALHRIRNVRLNLEMYAKDAEERAVAS